MTNPMTLKNEELKETLAKLGVQVPDTATRAEMISLYSQNKGNIPTDLPNTGTSAGESPEDDIF